MKGAGTDRLFRCHMEAERFAYHKGKEVDSPKFPLEPNI